MAKQGACHRFEARGKSPVAGPDAELPVPGGGPVRAGRPAVPRRPRRRAHDRGARDAPPRRRTRARDRSRCACATSTSATCSRCSPSLGAGGFVVDGDVAGRASVELTRATLDETLAALRKGAGVEIAASGAGLARRDGALPPRREARGRRRAARELRAQAGGGARPAGGDGRRRPVARGARARRLPGPGERVDEGRAARRGARGAARVGRAHRAHRRGAARARGPLGDDRGARSRWRAAAPSRGSRCGARSSPCSSSSSRAWRRRATASSRSPTPPPASSTPTARATGSRTPSGPSSRPTCCWKRTKARCGCRCLPANDDSRRRERASRVPLCSGARAESARPTASRRAARGLARGPTSSGRPSVSAPGTVVRGLRAAPVGLGRAKRSPREKDPGAKLPGRMGIRPAHLMVRSQSTHGCVIGPCGPRGPGGVPSASIIGPAYSGSSRRRAGTPRASPARRSPARSLPPRSTSGSARRTLSLDSEDRPAPAALSRGKVRAKSARRYRTSQVSPARSSRRDRPCPSSPRPRGAGRRSASRRSARRRPAARRAASGSPGVASMRESRNAYAGFGWRSSCTIRSFSLTPSPSFTTSSSSPFMRMPLSVALPKTSGLPCSSAIVCVVAQLLARSGSPTRRR